MNKRKTTGELTGRAFEALPAAEKDLIIAVIERGTPEQRRAESRPMNAPERQRWNRIKNKMGRPKLCRVGVLAHH